MDPPGAWDRADRPRAAVIHAAGARGIAARRSCGRDSQLHRRPRDVARYRCARLGSAVCGHDGVSNPLHARYGAGHEQAGALEWAQRTLDPRWRPLLGQVRDDRGRGWDPSERPRPGSAAEARAFAAYAVDWAAQRRAPRRSGAPGRIRTADASLRTAALYPLSYGGAAAIVPRRRGGRHCGVRIADQMAVVPSPTSSSTTRPGCRLCDEAREALEALLADRRTRRPAGRRRRRARHRDRPRPAAPRSSSEIPVVELGERRVELIVTRRQAAPGLSPRSSTATAADPGPNLTRHRPSHRGRAGRGSLSFLSPCVLPLVPAYLGQLTAVAVVGRADGAASRWLARQARARVCRRLRGRVHDPGRHRDVRRRSARRFPAAAPRSSEARSSSSSGSTSPARSGSRALERTWRPLEAGAAGSLRRTTGTIAFGSVGGTTDRARRWPTGSAAGS